MSFYKNDLTDYRIWGMPQWLGQTEGAAPKNVQTKVQGFVQGPFF